MMLISAKTVILLKLTHDMNSMWSLKDAKDLLFHKILNLLKRYKLAVFMLFNLMENSSEEEC